MAEIGKRRRREPVDHPERICANPGCRTSFKPLRDTQTFHESACRKAYWREAYHWQPHPCPYCTVLHDPEERPMLDALEHWIGENASPGTGGAYDQVWTQDLKAWIARRRAILRGEVGAATTLRS